MDTKKKRAKTKKSVLITIDHRLHDFAKENIKNFSGFVEKSVSSLSSSMSGSC
jgi:hypothetical protein